MIQILHNSDIDPIKWDAVIASAVNSRAYAEMWYLDIIAPDWHGIIYGDYEYVMPLIKTRKYGITYLFQPAFVQQHGIFPPSTPKITTEIMACLKSNFSYFNISLNSMNVTGDKDLRIEDRKNHILSLKSSYNENTTRYNAHAKRYVKKAHKNCDIFSYVDLTDFMKLKEQVAGSRVNPQMLKILKLIISKALNSGKGTIYGAFSKRNELVAAAFYLHEKKRFTYLNSVSTEEGKELRAMYAIVDKFIQDHSNSNYLLDFEGSNISGIARFFAGFGAEPETYQHIQYNNLPWYLKLIKK